MASCSDIIQKQRLKRQDCPALNTWGVGAGVVKCPLNIFLQSLWSGTSQRSEASATELHGISAGQPRHPHFPEKGLVRCTTDGLACEPPVSLEEAAPLPGCDS